MSEIIIFTDGACSGNPGPGGWASILSLPDGTIRELGGGDRATTNNRMEMSAAVEALALIPDAQTSNVILYTDSTYLIKGITQWIWGWRSRGWKNAEGKDVANRDLWEDLARQITRLKPATVDWRYVRGHAQIPGNERCDEIAVAFSKNYPINLYEGPKTGYTVNLDAVPAPEALSAPKAKSSTASGAKGSSYSAGKSSSSGGKSSSSSGGPVTYLSMLGGVVMRHASWSGCESRVKGQSNAKFKKAKSAQEELEILASWGVSPGGIVES